MKISTIIPVFKCSDCLNDLVERLINTLSNITNDFDIILVNDSSPDNSWEEIKKITLKDVRVKGINLSRNFGQHNAISAGLDYADGDWAIVMDCDLQDQPEEIIKLYQKAKEGFDVVFGERNKRNDSMHKKLGSWLFYSIYNYCTDYQSSHLTANFSIISKKVVLAFQKLKEQNRSYYLFVNWLGFKRTTVKIEHKARAKGKSSYTFFKLINLAIDNILTYSNKPLKISVYFGFLLTFFSSLAIITLIIRYFVYSINVEGWTSIIVSILFLGGLLSMNIGIAGLYLGKIFDETKKRPIYVIEEKTF